MKRVLTGFSNNISANQQKIKVWSESFRKFSNDPIVLIVANVSEEDIIICNNLNIDYYKVEEHDLLYINHKRLLHTKRFIESYDAELFLVTDVFDVVFQANPFAKLNTDDFDLFFTSEGLLVREEPWNGDVIKKVFGSDINICQDYEIVCSGIIAGKKEALINLYIKMYDKCEAGTNDHNIKDQAALIVLLANNELDKYHILNLNDGWAIHCAAAGPTRFLKEWGLEQSLLKNGYNIPELKNDKVYTQNLKYDIVHQFNRIPEWQDALTKEYKKNSYKNVACMCTMSQPYNNLDKNWKEKIKLKNYDKFLIIDTSKDQTFKEGFTFTEDELRRNLNFYQEVSNKHYWNSEGNRNIIWFYAHLRMLYFYTKNPTYKYYWFFDDDITITDWDNFLENTDKDTSDFISYFIFKDDNVKDQPQIPIIDYRTTSKDMWFKRFPGHGDMLPENTTNLFGSFFPTVRYSNKAMGILLDLHKKGYYAYGEGFVPTVLNLHGCKLNTLIKSDNTSDLFDNTNNLVLHKNHKIDWEWI